MDKQQKREAFAMPKISDWNGKVENIYTTTNILMLIPWMEMGGSDKFNLEIVKNIDTDKFAVTIACTVKGENQWKSLFEQYTKDIHILPDMMDMSEYAEYISFLIKSKHIDVVFLSNSYYGYYLLPWLKCVFPHVAVIDYVHMAEWYWRNGGYARVSGVSESCLDKTLVCNNQTNQVLTDRFGRTKRTVETLYIGVDKDRFNCENVPYGKMRKQFQIPEDKIVILFPCRIHPQKRPFLMLEIAKRVLEKNSNILFFVAGDGPQYKELLSKIKKEKLSDFFICPGEVSEMENVYRDSDMTLICSLKEGLALTAYESCAMMTPVITADVGGQKELIDDSVGRVIPMYQDERDIDKREFDEKEIDAYVTAIEEILLDKTGYEQMCRNCRMKITSEFSTEVMIHKLEKIIQDTVDEVKSANRCETRQDQRLALAGNYLATYVEMESGGNGSNYGGNINEELKRIANSKWGRRAIKLMMKLKINKIFH